MMRCAGELKWLLDQRELSAMVTPMPNCGMRDSRTPNVREDSVCIRAWCNINGVRRASHIWHAEQHKLSIPMEWTDDLLQSKECLVLVCGSNLFKSTSLQRIWSMILQSGSWWRPLCRIGHSESAVTWRPDQWDSAT